MTDLAASTLSLSLGCNYYDTYNGHLQACLLQLTPCGRVLGIALDTPTGVECGSMLVECDVCVGAHSANALLPALATD